MEETKALSKTPGVVLLVAVAFLSACMLCGISVAATSLVLAAFGAEIMPYVFIATGVIVSLLSFGLGKIQQRMSTTGFAYTVFGLFIAIILVSRAGFVLPIAKWVAFLLLVTHTLLGQFNSVAIGGLAGKLFTVREIKRVYPKIMTGQVMGYMLFGASVPLLIGLVGSTENVVAVTAGVQALALIPLTFFVRRYRPQLAQASAGKARQRTRPFAKVMRARYVTSLLTYQILSVMGSQLAVYIFFAKAQERYPAADALSRFLGLYQAGMNLASILFLVLLAGYLLSRFGVGFGLAANPVVVAVLAAAMMGAGVVSGTAGMVFFTFAVSTRVLDIVFTNGTTGTAIKTCYQVVPKADRTVVESTVEGIGVPVAYGLTGLCLIAFNALPGVGTLHIVGFTVMVSLVWLAAGFVVKRDYPQMLQKILSLRELDPERLPLRDRTSLEALRRGLGSPKYGVVTYCFDTLVEVDPETAPSMVATLIDHPVPEVRLAVLDRVEALRIADVDRHLRRRLDREQDPRVRGRLVRTLAQVGGHQAYGEVVPHLEDPSPEVSLGAIVGLLRSGGMEGLLLAGTSFTGLLKSDVAAERALAARVVAEVGVREFVLPLEGLLADGSTEVRLAALEAAGKLGNPRLWPDVVAALDDPLTANAAACALVEGGETATAIADRLSAGPAPAPALFLELLRLCGEVGGADSIAVLRRYVADPDERVRSRALRSLSRCRYRAAPDELDEIEERLRLEVASAAAELAARLDVDEVDPATLLKDALEHRIDDAYDRMFNLLACLADPRSIFRARDNVFVESEERRAYALEILDTVLSRDVTQRVMPLVQDVSLADRLGRLPAELEEAEQPPEVRLRWLLDRPHMDDWTRSCAIHTLASGASADRSALAAVCEAEVSTPRGRLAAETASFLQRAAQDPAATGLPTVRKVGFLKAVALFENLRGEQLIPMTETGREVELAPGRELIREGEAGDSFYVIVDGSVEVISEQRGKVAVLGAYDVIGEMAVLTNEPRAATCVTVSRTRLFEISRQEFWAVLRDDPAVRLGIARVLVERVKERDKVKASRGRAAAEMAIVKAPGQLKEEDLPVVAESRISAVEKVLFLRGVELFEGVADTDLEWVAEAAEEIQLEAGMALTRQGEFGNSVYTIVEGTGAVMVEEDRVIATLGEGSVIGEMAVLTHEPRSATCVATSDLLALRIEGDDFQELVSSRPQLGLAVIRALVGRILAG